MNASQQIKHYLDIVWRRKWWVVVPLVLCVGASPFVLKRLPKVYRASTTILVTPQRLPEAFVRSTVTQRVEDRMASMSVQILSRSFLETVGREFGLIAADAAEPEIERVCGGLKGRVELEAGRNLSYFEVTVFDETPVLAAGIANRLAELFIEQNSQMRTEQASGTRETVEGWLAEKKAELDTLEGRIADYKRGHLWELSDQLNSNFELLETSRERVTTLNKEIQGREERLSDLKSQVALEGTLAAASPTDPDPLARQLAALEAELGQLLVSYTEENPAVRRKRTEIDDFRRRHPQLTQTAQTPGGPAPVSARRAELERVEREIAGLVQERRAAEGQIAILTARINNTPLREQELKNLTRGYDAIKKEYEDLLQKKDQAARAEELETSRKSEQFRVQDPARVPSAPYRPQPLIVVLVCLATGLGVGAGAVVVLEFLDQSLKSEDDFRRAFPDVPLLSAVPHVDPAATRSGPGRRRAHPGGRHAAMMLLATLLGLGGRLPGGWTS